MLSATLFAWFSAMNRTMMSIYSRAKVYLVNCSSTYPLQHQLKSAHKIPDYPVTACAKTFAASSLSSLALSPWGSLTICQSVIQKAGPGDLYSWKTL